MSIFRAPKRRVVLSYGTYDLFTPQHAARLQALSQLGSELIIGCASDAYCRDLDVHPQLDFASRREFLESCRFVSRVIALETQNQHRTDIVNYDVGILAMEAKWAGQFDGLQDVAQVYYLPQNPQPAQPVTLDHQKLALAI